MPPARYRLSVWTYRRLLRLYPERFRRRFADDMAADFAELIDHRANGRPLGGRVAAWRRALGDLAASVPGERRHARRERAARSTRRAFPMSTLLQDVRYAARGLARTPVFTAVVVLTLALGIGANAAIFSLVDAALLRPLPYPAQDRLVTVFEGIPRAELPKLPMSPPDILDLRDYQQSYESLGAYHGMEVELSGDGEPERAPAAKVTAGLFPTLGVQPQLGRLFTEEEDRPGSQLALISYGLWQRRFGGAPEVTGRSIVIDRVPHTIVGVMPSWFRFPLAGPAYNNLPADVWVPMAFTEAQRQGRGMEFNNGVIARLAPGVTLAAARAEADVLARRIQQNYPPVLRDGPYQLVMMVEPLRAELVGAVERPLVLLLGAVALVLLVASANVANLVLSRAVGRTREIAVRAALGAGSWRMMQSLLAESLVLALAGGGAGLLVTAWAVSAARTFGPANLPELHNAGIDARVVGFTLAVSILTAAIFGLAPALVARAKNLIAALRDAGRTTASRSRQRLQGALVVATVAMAVVLVTGAGLLGRSFERLVTSDAGFRPDNVLTASIALPDAAYRDASSVQSFYEALEGRLSSLPGVAAASLSSDLPLTSAERRAFTPDAPVASDGPPASVAVTWTVGAYFRALGIELRRGRTFDARDTAGSQLVVVISRSLAERYWPDQDPIGRRLKWGIAGSNTPWLTVVGVVDDVHEGPLGTAPMDHVYQPHAQMLGHDAFDGAIREMRVAVTASGGDAAGLTGPVLDEIRRLDRSLAVADVRTMRARVAGSVTTERLTAVLLAAFAAGALVLAALGLYGVLALAVANRTAEIGVRMALGAQRAEVIGLVVSRGVRLTLVGLVLGLGGALALGRFVASLLYETTPYDPATLGAVTGILLLVSVGASVIPAWRASRIDPIRALRVE